MTDDTHEPDELDEYSLQELARRTGQNPRTLRSWATRGLLDGPTSMGRSARWPAADLLRIRAVQALRQDPSTSLDEIQAMFRSASLEDLQGWVDRAHPGATEDTSDVELESTETALEYVRALRDQLRTEPDGLPPVALDARGSPPRWSAHSDAHEPFTSSEARRHRIERWFEVRVARGVRIKVWDRGDQYDSELYARRLARLLRRLIDDERT